MINEEKLIKSIGSKLSEFRHYRRLTQEALAEASGLSKLYISRVEKGKANPTISVLAKICNAMDLSVDIFFSPNSKKK